MPNNAYDGTNSQPPTSPYGVDSLVQVNATTWELTVYFLANSIVQESVAPYAPRRVMTQSAGSLELYVFRKLENADETNPSPLKMYDKSGNLTTDFSFKPLVVKKLFESPTIFTQDIKTFFGSNSTFDITYPYGSKTDFSPGETWGEWSSTVTTNLGDPTLVNGGTIGIRKPALAAIPNSGNYSWYHLYSVPQSVSFNTSAGVGFTVSDNGQLTFFPTGAKVIEGGVFSVEQQQNQLGNFNVVASGTLVTFFFTYMNARPQYIVAHDGISLVWAPSKVRINQPMLSPGIPRVFIYDASTFPEYYDFIMNTMLITAHCFPTTSGGSGSNLAVTDINEYSKQIPVIDGADYD
jgi:hypothetical protein